MRTPSARMPRHGSVNWTLVIMLGSLVVLGLLAVGLMSSRRGPPPVATGNTPSDPSKSGSESADEKPITVFCAASNKSVFDAIRQDYEREFGRKIDVQFGPSQTLLASAAVTGVGDLYLPADESYLDTARQRDLIDDQYSLATMQAVIAVPRGNPLKISKWDDLLKPDVRISLANPDAAAIGKLLKQSLTRQGLWDALHARTTVYKTTVNEVANDVKTGAVDAGIVFNAVLHDYDSLEAVVLPELKDVEANVAVGVLKTTAQRRQVNHFVRYLSAQDKGLKRYAEFGFVPSPGDTWEDVPELTLYAGSMLRPAIEQTITEFEQREGVRVTRVYNGCGILVAQMKAGQVPDAYFACDVEFMNQVKDLFIDPLTVSQNELVILVKKGNPHGIRNLKDLALDGLRVGIGHEKQCAMGWLTQRTFDEGGVREEVMKNVVVQTPTGDMLVNQMRSGSLDAAVVYLSNAAGAGEALDAIRIQGLPCSIAQQPFSIAKNSRHVHVAARLMEALRSAESHERFLREGFRWVDPEAAANE